MQGGYRGFSTRHGRSISELEKPSQTQQSYCIFSVLSWRDHFDIGLLVGLIGWVDEEHRGVATTGDPLTRAEAPDARSLGCPRKLTVFAFTFLSTIWGIFGDNNPDHAPTTMCRSSPISSWPKRFSISPILAIQPRTNSASYQLLSISVEPGT